MEEDPFLGEIRLFAGKTPPKGWALCNGQKLSIALNQSLFSLLGTTYGGDGSKNFALPDFRGRAPVHVNNASGIALGQKAGVESHTLNLNQLPAHTHTVWNAVVACNSAAGNQSNPSRCVPAKNTGTDKSYSAVAGTNEFFANDAVFTEVLPTEGQAFSNMMPYIGIHFIICIYGGLNPPKPI